MKKFAIVAAMTLAVFVYMIPFAYAGWMTEKNAASIWQRAKYIGAVVKGLRGEQLGTVRDLVDDASGNVAFVIVGYGGTLGYKTRETAIPFHALTFNSDHREFASDLTREEFASAPQYTSGVDLMDRASADAFYRFYGIAPPWGEAEDEYPK